MRVTMKPLFGGPYLHLAPLHCQTKKMHLRNDKFLNWARAHYGWEVKQMRGLDAGELALFVFHYVIDRFNYTKKPTYAYEIAWVFQRDRGTIGHVLQSLEADGDIVKVNPRTWHRRTLYLPKLEHAISWARPLIQGNVETDDNIRHLKKFHDENCPCTKLKA